MRTRPYAAAHTDAHTQAHPRTHTDARAHTDTHTHRCPHTHRYPHIDAPTHTHWRTRTLGEIGRALGVPTRLSHSLCIGPPGWSNLLVAAPLRGSYYGKTMRDAHWNLQLQDMHFDVVKKVMIDSLNELKAEASIVREVDDMIESLRKQIVSVIPVMIQRIGGEDMLEKICNVTIDKAQADKRIKQYFQSVDHAKLKKNFKYFLMAQMGGINR